MARGAPHYPPRIAVFSIPDFPALCVGMVPELPGMVLENNRVVSATWAARQNGVVEGMRKREAQRAAPDATSLERDLHKEVRNFEAVLAEIKLTVASLEVLEAGAGAFESKGPCKFFGGESRLVSRLVGQVDQVVSQLFGLPLGKDGRLAPQASTKMAIADGLFAAQLGVRHLCGINSIFKQDGLLIPHTKSAAFLAQMPMSVFGNDDLAGLFARLGVHVLEEFACLKRSDVVARFGPQVGLFHDFASGFDPRPMNLEVPEDGIEVRREFDPPLNNVDQVAFAAKVVADELWGILESQGLRCRRLLVFVETEHGEEHSRWWRHDGRLSAGSITERVRWQLDNWLLSGGPTSGISLLKLIPGDVGPASGDQDGLWGGMAASDKMIRTLSRIQGMLGPERVVVGLEAGGRSPFEQVQLVPWGDSLTPNRDPKSPWPGALPEPSPTLVFTELRPVVVSDRNGAPITVNAKGLISATPRRITFESGDMSEITGWSGPWPIEERWWSELGRRLARFQIVLSDGRAYLASVEKGRWHLEAQYD